MTKKVCVLDIEPMEPPVGGSRLRLKGLYQSLGSDFDVTYVGAFHWSGSAYRRLRHSPHLEEVTIPFSKRHLDAASILQSNTGVYPIIDASFPLLGGFSEEYCNQARQHARDADIVVLSHPWVYWIVRDAIDRSRQALVYDAHNVEMEIKPRLIGKTQAGQMIAQAVEKIECELCREADLVVACTQADRERFVRRARIPFEKTRLTPNGVATDVIAPANRAQRVAAKCRLNLPPRSLAVFVGGRYPPNAEAAEFICRELAPRCRRVTFAILGSVCDGLDQNHTPPANVRLVGPVSEQRKQMWLKAADLGINPMFSGSGSNIKMLDYMAGGLAVVATPFGARGIECAHLRTASSVEGLVEKIRDFDRDGVKRRRVGRYNRAVVAREFDWRILSREFGAVLTSRLEARRGRPFFSVTIPTLDRPDRLRRLLDLLAQQSDRDFEVIVVDQSLKAIAHGDCGLDLTVVHSRVKGAAHARNVAAAVARGKVIACTDDDCEPGVDWLAAARPLFADRHVVGVEGRCFSDRRFDSSWRAVHNYGAEGDGFMTCNLFVTAEAFHRVGGFDTGFDDLQFRYDTDFGWRLREIGKVPFSEEAFVYHPPWPRNLKRESHAERDRLFEMDALLLKKHPDDYRRLFLRERHWLRGEKYWRPFLRGVRRYEVQIPQYIREAYGTVSGGRSPRMF